MATAKAAICSAFGLSAGSKTSESAIASGIHSTITTTFQPAK